MGGENLHELALEEQEERRGPSQPSCREQVLMS